MAEEREAPVVKLPAEVKVKLDKMSTEISGARRGIAALKHMGMETRALEDKLEWAEEVRKTLLKEFS